MNYIKHSVNQCIKSINLNEREITFKKLYSALSKKGFIIKKYSEAGTLLIAFGLYDESKEADSVSALDNNGNPYVFLDDKLPTPKRLFALAHEVGHITLGHKKPIDEEEKSKQEAEADMFAHYLLSGKNTPKTNFATLILSVLLSVCIILIALLVFFLPQPQAVPTSVSSKNSTIYSSNPSPEINSNTICYFTKYGEVYHIYSDCSYIKNSETIYTSTIGNCKHDRMCSRCRNRMEKDNSHS